MAAKLAADSDRGRRLILELAGVPVGEMNYRTAVERTAEIGIKICDPGSRGQGHGTAYLRMLIS